MNTVIMSKEEYPTTMLSGIYRITGEKETVQKEKAKVPDVHAHRFRRTCATIYLNRGMPVEQVKILLGHESISTTQLYINVNEEAMRLNHERYTN